MSKSSRSPGRTLVSCRYQAVKVRVVFWFSAIIALVACISGWMIFQTFGTSPGDGGVLRPFAERAMAGGIVALLGLSFFAGMVLYTRLYVLELRRSQDEVHLTTMALFAARSRTLQITEVGEINFYAGRMFTPRGQSVNAPWFTVPVRGQWFPYIVDAQAETVDRRQLQRLAKDAARARKAEPSTAS